MSTILYPRVSCPSNARHYQSVISKIAECSRALAHSSAGARLAMHGECVKRGDELSPGQVYNGVRERRQRSEAL